MQRHQWYEIKAGARDADTADVYIYGDIGDQWNESSVTAAKFVKELAALEAKKIVVHINSYGGSVSDGLAIYNALRAHPAETEAVVEGVAVSCASYIPMGCDRVVMAENALMMIHAPWGAAIGNASDLRAAAEVLELHARAMASGYAAKSGKDFSDCLALLTDGEDHWFSAAEALQAGFADAIGPAVDSRALFLPPGRYAVPERYRLPAAAAALSPMERPMTETNTHVVSQPEPRPVPAPEAEMSGKAASRTVEENRQIVAIFAPFAHRPEIASLEKEVLVDPSIGLERARAMLLEALGKYQEPAAPVGAHPRVEIVEDERDKRIEAATQAILARARIGPPADLRGNPYRGMSMFDIARECAARAGVRISGMNKMEVVGAAFTQSTSDFPVLLENTMRKSLQAGYALEELTWRRFCAIGTVSDFRAHKRYRVGGLSNLDAVSELGEFKNKPIPDGESESITAKTMGNIINLSRQAVINDDLGAFVGLAEKFGRAAARTIEADVYALLTANGGLGVTMDDGKTLFHADHGNISAPAALSVDAIDADRVLMAQQKDVGGNDYLNLRPALLLVPISLGGKAREINAQEYNDESNRQQRRPNSVRGLFRDVIDTPRLTGTRRYLFADPGTAPVIEVAFLDGIQEPYIEVQDGFDVDGMRMKVRLDYAADVVDWRGAVTNAGA